MKQLSLFLQFLLPFSFTSCMSHGDAQTHFSVKLKHITHSCMVLLLWWWSTTMHASLRFFFALCTNVNSSKVQNPWNGLMVHKKKLGWFAGFFFLCKKKSNMRWWSWWWFLVFDLMQFIGLESGISVHFFFTLDFFLISYLYVCKG